MSVVIETAPRRGPVCCWRHARASLAGRGAPFHRARHYERCGPPMNGLSWLRVMSRCAHSHLVSEVWLWSRAFMFMVVKEARASAGFVPSTNGNRAPLRSGETKPRSRPLAVHSILIVREHEFPIFGYPKIGTRQQQWGWPSHKWSRWRGRSQRFSNMEDVKTRW
jgi:hypothetical protein